jgi:hypothetical protein
MRPVFHYSHPSIPDGGVPNALQGRSTTLRARDCQGAPRVHPADAAYLKCQSRRLVSKPRQRKPSCGGDFATFETRKCAGHEKASAFAILQSNRAPMCLDDLAT